MNGPDQRTPFAIPGDQKIEEAIDALVEQAEPDEKDAKKGP